MPVMTSSRSPASRMAISVFLACVGGLATACGSGAGSSATPAATVTVTSPSSGSAGAPTATPTATPAAAPSPTGPPSCASSALRASLGRGSGAAGSAYYPVELINVSGSTCTLYGYPGVSFVTRIGGSQIGAAARQDHTFARRLVTLAPGATAHAQLQVVDAENFPAAECGLVTAHWLKVFPPGQFGALYIKLKASACSSAAKPVRVLAIQTVQPGKGGQ
jgi:hypothetical protein